jgi:hypothetical protein
MSWTIDQTAFLNTISPPKAGMLFEVGMTQAEKAGVLALVAAFFRFNPDNADPRHLAYILATAYHETAGTMQPVTERGSSAYLRGRPYWPYIGRGYVQLTWEANYRKMGQKIGRDLCGPNMDRACDPDIAAEIIVSGMRDGTFTGHSLSYHFNATTDEPIIARKIINGLDRASTVALYHSQFLKAIKASLVPSPAATGAVS